MNYANTISRNGKTTKKRKSVTTVPAVGQFERWMKRPKDAGELLKDKQKSVPPANVANAFLKMRFYPRLQETEIVQDCDRLKMDRDFKKSLSLIAVKFNLSIQHCTDIPFPYNIAESMANPKETTKNDGCGLERCQIGTP